MEETSSTTFGKVMSVNIGKVKGIGKKPQKKIILKENYGVIGDIHAGTTDKQVSLLSIESIKKFKNEKCPKIKGWEIGPGSFAENITTKGINLKKLKIGDKIKIKDVVLEVTKIGKDCHRYCSIYYKTGDCLMPKEGVFCKVIKGGEVKVNDEIVTIEG